MGDDPHFSISLPDGRLLCYTVQGMHGFAFNLISSERFHMNAMFVPDARRAEVTWIGSLGMVIHQMTEYQGSNFTKITFTAKSKEINIGGKVTLHATKVDKLTFENGKISISEASPTATRFRNAHYPSVTVNLREVGLHFTVMFVGDQHLDLFWHSSVQDDNSHGLIGKYKVHFHACNQTHSMQYRS